MFPPLWELKRKWVKSLSKCLPLFKYFKNRLIKICDFKSKKFSPESKLSYLGERRACLSRVYFSRYPPNGELARRLKKFKQSWQKQDFSSNILRLDEKFLRLAKYFYRYHLPAFVLIVTCSGGLEGRAVTTSQQESQNCMIIERFWVKLTANGRICIIWTSFPFYPLVLVKVGEFWPKTARSGHRRKNMSCPKDKLELKFFSSPVILCKSICVIILTKHGSKWQDIGQLLFLHFYGLRQRPLLYS